MHIYANRLNGETSNLIFSHTCKSTILIRVPFSRDIYGDIYKSPKRRFKKIAETREIIFALRGLDRRDPHWRRSSEAEDPTRKPFARHCDVKHAPIYCRAIVPRFNHRYDDKGTQKFCYLIARRIIFSANTGTTIMRGENNHRLINYRIASAAINPVRETSYSFTMNHMTLGHSSSDNLAIIT